MNRTFALIMVLCAVILAADRATADVTPAPPAAGPPGAAPALDSAAIENQRILESRPSQPNPSIELARPLDTLKVVASLAVIIVFVVAAVWALRRFAPGAVKMYSSENLKVISRTYIAPKQMVCLMKAPGKLLVVGSTQTSISLLSEITDPNQIELILGSAEAASARGASAAFRELLSGSARGRRGGRVAEEDLAAAVTSVSERFADLTSKLERPGKGGF